MKSLIFTYNVRDPFAGLAEDGHQLRFLREADYYKPVDPQSAFPENAIRQILVSCGEIDNIIFLGKPFLYLENLISLHAFMFPREYRRFASDLFSFFTEVANPRSIVSRLIEEDKLVVTGELDKVYYIRQDEALAHVAEAEPGSTIITCLSDVFEGTSCCCFEKREQDAVMTGEVEAVESFANILRLNAQYGADMDLKELVSVEPTGSYRFRKPNIRIMNNAFEKRQTAEMGKGSFETENEKTVSAIFSRLLASVTGNGRQVVFISDTPVCQRLVGEHGDVKFVQVSDEEKSAAAAQFFHDKRGVLDSKTPTL